MLIEKRNNTVLKTVLPLWPQREGPAPQEWEGLFFSPLCRKGNILDELNHLPDDVSKITILNDNL